MFGGDGVDEVREEEQSPKGYWGRDDSDVGEV